MERIATAALMVYFVVGVVYLVAVAVASVLL